MTDINATKHFVRINGKVLGPFDATQLRSLKERGRLRGEHEISANRKNWTPASDVAGLFLEAASPVATSFSDGIAEAPQSPESTQWYYTSDGEQQGPVSIAQLKRLAVRGLLSDDDLIWNSSLPDWIPARNQPGLMPARAPRAGINRDDRKGQREKSAADSQTLLWSAILAQVQNLTDVSQLRNLLRSIASIGGIAMLIAMALIGLIFMTIAIKTNTFAPTLAGAALILCVSALRFAGLHSLQAGENLIFKSAEQISSWSLPKVVGVFLLTAGTILSVTAFVVAIEASEASQKILLMTVSGGFFSVFVIGSCFILFPAGLNISISAESPAGQDGAAILSFLLKSLMRSSSFLFLAGSIMACVSLSAIAYLVSTGNELVEIENVFIRSLIMDGLMEFSLFSLTMSGLVPLAAYILLATGNMILGSFQSILSRSQSSSGSFNADLQRAASGGDYE